MARAPKTKPPAESDHPWEEPAATPARATKATKTSPGTEVVPWEEELKEAAIAEAEKEKNAGGGQFFSLQAGQLSLGGQPVKNNRMGVILLDTMFENIFYEGAFDPKNPAPPTCFAFAHNEDELAPHKVVFELEQAQNPQCRGCPMNQWGSADTGKGKACRNTRRLALIAAGTLDDNGAFTAEKDPEFFAKAGIALLKIPVTSVNGYASFVKNTGAAMGRPPHGIFTRVSVVPDAKSQFRVLFEAIGPISQEVYMAIRGRLAEARTLNLVPYDMTPAAPAEAPRRGGRQTSNRPPVQKGAAAAGPAKRAARV